MTFTWTYPSGSTVSTLEKHIDNEVSKGVGELTTNSTSTLQTGVWKISVQTNGIDVAELPFLVLPISHNTGHLSEKDDTKSMLAHIDWLTSQFWYLEGLCSLESIGSECLNIELCRNTEWSSMSPDPKSDITTDDKIKYTK